MASYNRLNRALWPHARCPHHVEYARGKAEQKKHDQPPRRNAKPAVEQPAQSGADQHTGNKLGGEPKATRHRRRIGGRRSAGAVIDRTAAALTQPFTETLKPRGESGFVGRAIAVVAIIARAVGHAFDTRASRQPRTTAVLKSRADHTEWVYPSQESQT